LNAAGSNNMDTENSDLNAWHDLYVVLGTSSGALLGLLFVATSIHLGEIVSNPGLRVRSNNQTLYLLTLLVEAVVILVPLPVPFLGAELMVLNLVGLWIFSGPITRSSLSTGTRVIAAARGGNS
jgi:hypothetical protein